MPKIITLPYLMPMIRCESLSVSIIRSRIVLKTSQDNKDSRHVKTYEVNLKDKDFVDGPWNQHNLDAGSCLIIPVPTP